MIWKVFEGKSDNPIVKQDISGDKDKYEYFIPNFCNNAIF